MHFCKPAGWMKLRMAPYILFEERQACFEFCVVFSAAGFLVPAGWGWLDQCNYPRGRHCAWLHPSALLPHLRAAAWVRVRVSGAGQEQIRLEWRQQTLHLLHKHQRYERFMMNENYDIAVAMPSSHADPVLGHCPGWEYLNIWFSVTVSGWE